MTDDVGTLYCRFVDSLNHRALGDLDQFLAARVVQHATNPMANDPVVSGLTVGIDAARQELARWLEAVPDGHLVIEDLVVEGDHLMARLRATGTPRLPRDRESARSRLSVPVFEAWSVRDGRCVERWLHVDRDACPSPPRDGADQGADD